MSVAIPPLPNMPSWRGAQLKHRDNFTFAFIFTLHIFSTLRRRRRKMRGDVTRSHFLAP
jgi:hypothetical protein